MKKLSVDYKYPIKAEVYYIDTEMSASYVECHMCLGEGSLIRKDKTKITCPTCNGKKKVSVGGSIINVVKAGFVNSVFIDIGSENTINTAYGLDVSDDNSKTSFYEFELYETKAEAQKECDKMNDKYTMGYQQI